MTHRFDVSNKNKLSKSGETKSKVYIIMIVVVVGMSYVAHYQLFLDNCNTHLHQHHLHYLVLYKSDKFPPIIKAKWIFHLCFPFFVTSSGDKVKVWKVFVVFVVGPFVLRSLVAYHEFKLKILFFAVVFVMCLCCWCSIGVLILLRIRSEHRVYF